MNKLRPILVMALIFSSLGIFSGINGQNRAKKSFNPDNTSYAYLRGYHSSSSNRSQYGGFKHIKFDPTGYFYLHKDKRWWFVDPEGHAFLSFGLNHVEPNRMLYSWNRPYWAKKFGLDIDAPNSAYTPYAVEKMKEDMTAFGFNSLGPHNALITTNDFRKHRIPYVKKVEFVRLNHYQTHTKEDFPDVWSDEYEKHVEKVVKQKVTPVKDDPYLMGYFMTACPIYTDLEAALRPNTVHGIVRPATPTWSGVIRNMDASHPGKQQYLKFIKARYKNDIAAFNKVYQTVFTSFKELERENWRPGVDETNQAEMEDNAQFLFLIVDKAYKMQTEAIRSVDKNHLIFGDKINGNADTRDEIVQLADKYFDLIFYGYYALHDDHIELMNRWSKLTDKPFYSADCGINTPSRQMPDPFGPHAPTQQVRADWTYEALDGCFSRDNFVGWGQCGWIDQWYSGEAPLMMQHGGLQDPYGNPHLPMLHAMSHFSALMYERYVTKDANK